MKRTGQCADPQCKGQPGREPQVPAPALYQNHKPAAPTMLSLSPAWLDYGSGIALPRE
jgi:hypothetical protein